MTGMTHRPRLAARSALTATTFAAAGWLGLYAVAWGSHITAPIVNVTRTPLQVNGYLEYQANPGGGAFGDEWTGWVDIRHPVLDGTKSAASPFDRSNRRADVKTIIVTDNANSAAAPNVKRDFDFANKIYAQAGLTILHETTGGGSDTLKLDGTGSAPNVTWPISNADLITMFGEKRSGNAETINNYYVQSYNPGANGKSLQPQNTPDDDEASSEATSSYVPNTAAHEWGHLLLNSSAKHVEAPGLTSESADKTNLMFLAGTESSTTLNEVGLLGRHDIVTSAQAEQMFANAGDKAPHNNPGYVQRPSAADHTNNLHKYGNRVDWDFVVDHKKLSFNHNVDHDLDPNTAEINVMVTGGLEDEEHGLDAHKGEDALFWGIPAAALSGGDQTGHDHTGLGEFAHPGDFSDASFRFVDVFSNSVRYSDYDRDGANQSIRQGALDYDVTFRKADGTTAAGVPVVSFQPGWTGNTNADDYLTRWVAPFDATGVLVSAKTTDGHDGTAQIDAVIAGNMEHSSTGPLEGYFPSLPDDPDDDFFVDAKSPPLTNKDGFFTTWSMHTKAPETNYAGFLFDITYDGKELTSLSIAAAGPHFGMEVPGGNGVFAGGGGPFGTLIPGIALSGSQAGSTVAGAIAAWIDPAVAGASGITLAPSSLVDLFHVFGDVKATTPANNSDIDITIKAHRIKHVPGAPGESVPVVLMSGDYLYVTPGGGGLPETGPGFGLWEMITTPGTIVLSLPASGFYATSRSLVNMAGYGLEHVPEPGGLVILLLGAACLAAGRARR